MSTLKNLFIVFILTFAGVFVGYSLRPSKIKDNIKYIKVAKEPFETIDYSFFEKLKNYSVVVETVLVPYPVEKRVVDTIYLNKNDSVVHYPVFYSFVKSKRSGELTVFDFYPENKKDSAFYPIKYRFELNRSTFKIFYSKGRLRVIQPRLEYSFTPFIRFGYLNSSVGILFDIKFSKYFYISPFTEALIGNSFGLNGGVQIAFK